jgi:hypothetical protein
VSKGTTCGALARTWVRRRGGPSTCAAGALSAAPRRGMRGRLVAWEEVMVTILPSARTAGHQPAG